MVDSTSASNSSLGGPNYLWFTNWASGFAGSSSGTASGTVQPNFGSETVGGTSQSPNFADGVLAIDNVQTDPLPIPGSGPLAALGGLALIGGLALRRRMAKIH